VIQSGCEGTVVSSSDLCSGRGREIPRFGHDRW